MIVECDTFSNIFLFKAYSILCKNIPFEIKMFIFLFCLFWNNQAVNTKCLPKHGFGISQEDPQVRVDENSTSPSNLSECQNQCDNLVLELLFIS